MADTTLIFIDYLLKSLCTRGLVYHVMLSKFVYKQAKFGSFPPEFPIKLTVSFSIDRLFSEFREEWRQGK